VKTIKSKNNTS